jgi:hypothetical protein
MPGYQRHASPTGVEPGNPKVSFAGVTEISRPVTNDEHWTLYYFEAHAAQCDACQDPLRVARAGRQLCRTGHELAIDVADLIYRRKYDKVYSRVKDGEREVRVEIPHDYEQTLSLLQAISRAVRKGEKFPTKPRSMDKTYYVEPRISPDRTERDSLDGEAQPLSMRRPYDTKLVAPKSPRPKPKPRRQERESTEDLISDMRGSLYGDDMRRLEKAEKREQDIRYNIEVREPNFKQPRRPHVLYP